MRHAKILLVVACLSGSLLPISKAATGRLTVGVIADQKDFQDGGCELFLAAQSDRNGYRRERYVFMSDFHANAVMNINGRDVKLTLLRSMESQWRDRIGNRTRYWYGAGPIVIDVDYTLTGTCSPKQESCEIFYYSATIRVTRGALRRTVLARGLCGT